MIASTTDTLAPEEFNINALYFNLSSDVDGLTLISAIHSVEGLVERLRKSLPELFDSDVYRKGRAAAAESAKERHKERLKDFEKKIEGDGFTLVQVQAGPYVRPTLMPLVAGNAIDMDQLDNLVEEGKYKLSDYDRFREKHSTLMVGLEAKRK